MKGASPSSVSQPRLQVGRSIFKPSGTLGGSENATAQGFILASAPRRAPPGPISPCRLPSPRAYWRVSLCCTSAYREARGSRALSAIASAQIWQKEFGTLSINRSMRPAMIYVPDTAPPRKRSSRVLGVVHAPICGETRAKCGRAVSECISGPCSANRASQLPNPWSKPSRRPVTEFRRPCLKRAERRIDLERWQ